VVANVEDLVASVRLHREADPDFEQAIAQLVNAESELGGTDPVEGSVVAEPAPMNTDNAKPVKGKRKGASRG
jgi:hypothetical protein